MDFSLISLVYANNSHDAHRTNLICLDFWEGAEACWTAGKDYQSEVKHEEMSNR
jgi:hypothetical protein